MDEARVYLKVCQEKLDAAKKRIEVRPETASAEPGQPAGPPLEDLEGQDTLL